MYLRIVPDIVLLGLMYIFVFYKRWKNDDHLILKSILYLYFCGVILVTLMPFVVNLPFVFNHPYKGMNMRPFEDLIMARGDYVRQIVLNIIMMIPFGVLYPLIYKAKLHKTVWRAFQISLAIELVQPFISIARSADITDILNNVLGAILGYSVYKVVSLLFVKKR